MINVATDSRISLNHLFTTMKELVGSPVNVSYGPTRSGDVKDSQADITRAREILGYKPIVTFEEGLRRTLEWYRTQTNSNSHH